MYNPDISPERLAQRMASDMEIDRLWRKMEEQRRAEYESMLATGLVLLIAGLLVADFMLAFAWSNPIIQFAQAALTALPVIAAKAATMASLMAWLSLPAVMAVAVRLWP
jgi:hypothetical protein